MLTHYIAACVSKGYYWPDGGGTVQMGTVFILSCEDSIEHTIKPRLVAVGADETKIKLVRGIDTPAV